MAWDSLSLRGLNHTTDEVPSLGNRTPTDEVQPLRPDRAHLAVVLGTAACPSFPLERMALELGRSPACSGWIPEPDVSRRHARVQHLRGRFVLTDLDSRNGTRVNGAPIREHVLQSGDVIALGASTVLIFSHHDPLSERLLHRHRNETVGRLAGGVAHDFNEILTAISNNVQYLQQTHCDPAEQAACLTEIREAADSGASLSRRLLDFARAAAREERPLDFSRLLEESVELCRSTFGATISLRATIQPGLHVHGDRLQLLQALTNLLVNARDAMGPDGEIVVRAAEDGPHVRVTVADDGAGMDEAARRQAFEPFFSRKEGGSGLGLALTRGIVRDHRGRIELDSAPGQGTTARLWLPRVQPPPPITGPGHPTVEVAPRRGCVLVVDDDDLVRKSTVRLLTALGHEALEARDGLEALKVFADQRRRIDLVLLDQVMPRMGGRETFHELRALDPTLPVLAISGYEEQESIQELLDAGACGFLAKPVSARVLEQHIREALKRRS